jgi:hypothetical protein
MYSILRYSFSEKQCDLLFELFDNDWSMLLKKIQNKHKIQEDNDFYNKEITTRLFRISLVPREYTNRPVIPTPFLVSYGGLTNTRKYGLEPQLNTTKITINYRDTVTKSLFNYIETVIRTGLRDILKENELKIATISSNVVPSKEYSTVFTEARYVLYHEDSIYDLDEASTLHNDIIQLTKVSRIKPKDLKLAIKVTLSKSSDEQSNDSIKYITDTSIVYSDITGADILSCNFLDVSKQLLMCQTIDQGLNLLTSQIEKLTSHQIKNLEIVLKK